MNPHETLTYVFRLRMKKGSLSFSPLLIRYYITDNHRDGIRSTATISGTSILSPLVALSVRYCQGFEIHPLWASRRLQCGCLSGVKISRHFLNAETPRPGGMRARPRNTLGPFYQEISARRSMANGFWALDTPWLIENAGGVLCGTRRGGLTFPAVF